MLQGGTNTGAFPYALAAMLYSANMFGLPTDYAYPEAANVSAAMPDHLTTLAKLLTRTYVQADGMEYDAWDCLQTITKWILKQDPTINADEVNAKSGSPRHHGGS